MRSIEVQSGLPDWMSHLPLLAAATAASTGPVLELGCGHGSTPLLHEMCRPTRRPILSVESNGHWLAEVRHLETPWHRFRLVGPYVWPTLVERPADWGLVFVDHGQGEMRADSIEAFSDPNWGGLLVVHDSHPGGVELYRYGPAFAKFAHRWTYTAYWPHTTVLSHARPWCGPEGDPCG